MTRASRPRAPRSNHMPHTAGGLVAMSADLVFVLVALYFPGRSPRWVAEACRAGRIPGARRVGKSWMWRAVDAARFAAGDSAAADCVLSEP